MVIHGLPIRRSTFADGAEGFALTIRRQATIGFGVPGKLFRQ
jgi:hypothetical protein